MEETVPISHPLVYLLLLSTSLFLPALLSGHSLDTICSEKEKTSLLEFKAKLVDPNRTLSSWTEEDNCCRWKGVGCNKAGVVVILDLHNPIPTNQYDLDFYNLGLSGEIDPSLLSLQNLQHLDLSGNNFNTSSFPSFIGSFKELRYLNLSTTSIVGVIPSQFGNLKCLEFLDLSYNSDLTLETVEGLSFLTHLSSLKYIDMSGVNLSISITDLLQELNSLPSISVIRLNECSTPSIPQSLLFPQLNFKNLTVLALGFNMIFTEFKIPDWLFKIKTLEQLDLSDTNSYTFSLSESSTIPIAIGDLYRLKFLDLSGNSLTGSIPDSIGNLSLLQEIRLNGNNLVGHIPESLGRGLLSLRILDFSYNLLGGSIPESVGRMQSLQQLDLSDNILSGPIPTSIGNLSSLQELNLRYNELIGPIPASLKSLVIFDLSNNRFSGSIPTSLCGLGFLRTLDLSWNEKMNGTIPECVWGLEKLEILGLGGKGLQGVLSETHFSKLHKLESLTITASELLIINISQDWIPPFSLSDFNMHSCIVGPKFPMWLQTQDKLVILNLEDVRLSENPPVWIWNFSSSIFRIDMSRNQMKGRLPDAKYAPELVEIDLSYNKFEGSNWLSNIWKMVPNVHYLTVAVNNFSGAIPSSLCNLPLSTLDLSLNNFSGEIPGCLMKVQNHLNFASNNLSGGFPTPINGSECSLWYLNIEANSLTGMLPEWLQNCRYFIILNLGVNRFTGNIPTWVAESMPSLTILDLSRNNLYGRIPSFSNFKAMQNQSTTTVPTTVFVLMDGVQVEVPETIHVRTSIDFSGNGLSGEIPQDIGSLLGLQSLNLSGNRLTGNIPKTISRLKALEKLDLSINNLSGEIPQCMSLMTTLNHLNLSFNNLSGEIPTSNQFSTFTDSSVFMGNPNLCGLFPYKSCYGGQIPISGEDHKNKIEILWVYLNLVLGFVVGFWLFYGTLLFKKTWRSSYNDFLQDFNEELHLRCNRVWEKISNKTK